jgi:hypothetical protein
LPDHDAASNVQNFVQQGPFGHSVFIKNHSGILKLFRSRVLYIADHIAVRNYFNKTFPFFKTLWLTLLNGLKGDAGVGKADEKNPTHPLTKIIKTRYLL